MTSGTYPKRLIEVDLPIARISAHARREKSIRHGHISTLHIWWARRPLAACRAVICASLWPDPADPNCPPAFRQAAVVALSAFSRRVNPERITAEMRQLQETLCDESRARWEDITSGKLTFDVSSPADMVVLRMALLDFIADFANWDNSTVPAYLETSRALTQAAHEALGGAPGTRPLVVDPFCGGGSIPLEALRVGADAFASDLNPVPVLLNKVVLEYIPKYGIRLAEEVRKWGAWIKQEAEKELAEFYPKDPDGATPIAYLWARTIRCEGPACGAEVPLIRSLWLAKKADRSVALRLIPNPQEKRVDFDILVKQRDGWVSQADLKSQFSIPSFDGTVKRGSATCPCCGYTTPVARVRAQFKEKRGGADGACLFTVVTRDPRIASDQFRTANARDYDVVRHATAALAEAERSSVGLNGVPLVPDEPTPLGGGSGAGRAFSQRHYGMNDFRDLFSSRQLLALTTISRFISQIPDQCGTEQSEFVSATKTCLAFALDKCTDYWNSIAGWMPRGTVGHAFARQAIQMVWDFVEANPISDFHCAWQEAFKWAAMFCDALAESNLPQGHAAQCPAQRHIMPTDSVDCLFTDPPYYDAVPYADLSDFFLVWLRRTVGPMHPQLLASLSPKDDECIVDDAKGKDHDFFTSTMSQALGEGCRYVRPMGVGVVVFAHKSTSGWEAQLQSIIDAGWIITASWPIDTERGARLRAMDSAALASSVHLICRPREDASGAVTESVGEWRDVLGELPQRIHEWMPRLAAEGVVGADAIFACLGPALEIFSRYRRVEKANGETAKLREYLEHVWAAVSTEALSLIFKDTSAAGLEPDARLTAMWLWTLGYAKGQTDSANRMVTGIDETANRLAANEGDVESAEEVDEEGSGKKANRAGFFLEFDAARKIAQGLGIDLGQSQSIVEIKGEIARLLPVAERTLYLFGKGAQSASSGAGRKKKVQQKTLFAELDDAEAAEAGWTALKGPSPGTTVLDRVHQAMILFAGNRGELLKRFLVEDGVGKDDRFWKLADNLNKLYPPGTEERRWVEGVLARKKGLGY
jgi:putative DNA methylase